MRILAWLSLLAAASCTDMEPGGELVASSGGGQGVGGSRSAGRGGGESGGFGSESAVGGRTQSGGGGASGAPTRSGGGGGVPGSSGGGAMNGGGGGAPAAAGGASGGATAAGGGPTSGGAGGASVQQAICRLELTCTRPIVDEPKRPCQLRIDDGAGTVLYMDHAGVELRGRTSLRYQKKNYGVELRTAAGAESPVPMMGMGKEADWIFDGSWIDRSFIRNDLVFGLSRDLGYYAAESRACTLSINGEKQGIYRLSEKIKRDDDRVVLPPDDGSGTSFLISQDDEGNLNFPVGMAFGSSVWELNYPKQATATPKQRGAVQGWLDGLSAVLHGPDAGNPTTGVFSYLDIESTADFILLQEFSKNIDGYSLSLALSKAPNMPAQFIPWDFDLSFGQPIVADFKGPHEAPEGWVENRTAFVKALTKIPALSARLGPRWRELRAGSFTDAAVLGKLDELRGVYDSATLAENFAIWPIQQVDLMTVYSPFSLYSVASYDEEVEHLRKWIVSRLAWLDAHIDSIPN